MQKLNLNQLIKQYWKYIELKSWDYLFKTDSIDQNIYYIDKWEIVLEKDWIPMINVWEWEIIWERSFLLKQNKPLDARVEENVACYCITNSDFDNIEFDVQKDFLSSLVLFLSERVYKMNDVISLIWALNKNILSYTRKFDDNKLLELFDKIIDLRWYIILNIQKWDFVKIAWDINYDLDIEDFIKSSLSRNLAVKIWKNYIFLCNKNYVYLLHGIPKIVWYVLSNVLMYSDAIFTYLWEKIIEKNEKEFIFKSLITNE